MVCMGLYRHPLPICFSFLDFAISMLMDWCWTAPGEAHWQTAILNWHSRAPLQGCIVYKILPPSFRSALGPADLQCAPFMWTYPGPPADLLIASFTWRYFWVLKISCGPYFYLKLIWGLAGFSCAPYTWSYSRVLLSLVASSSQLEFPHP